MKGGSDVSGDRGEQVELGARRRLTVVLHSTRVTMPRLIFEKRLKIYPKKIG